MDSLHQNSPEKVRKFTYNVLKNIFKRTQTTHRHHLLAQIPFTAYLTTNYDLLLEDACRYNSSNQLFYSTYPDLCLKDKKDNEIFYLHGRYSSEHDMTEQNIVLTYDEYEEAYSTDIHPSPSKGTLLPSFLQQCLPFYNICFLGCSLEDPYLCKIFKICRQHKNRIHDHGHPLDTRWYALLDSGDESEQDMNDIGIIPIYYDRKDESHKGLDEILDNWRSAPVSSLRPLGEEESVSYDPNVEVPK